MSRWLIFPFFLMWSFIMEDHDQDLSFLPLLIFPLWGSLWAGDQSLLSFSCDLSSWRIMMSRLSIFIFFLLWSFLLEDHNEQMINLSLLPLVIFPPGGSWWADDQSFPSSSCDLSSGRIMMSRWSISPFFLLWSVLLEDHDEQMINLSLLPLVFFPLGGS